MIIKLNFRFFWVDYICVCLRQENKLQVKPSSLGPDRFRETINQFWFYEVSKPDGAPKIV